MTIPSPPPPHHPDSLLAHIVNLSRSILSTSNQREAAQLIVSRIGEIIPIDRAVLLQFPSSKPIVAISTGLAAGQDNRFSDAVDEAINTYKEVLTTEVIPFKPITNEASTSPLSALQKSIEGVTIVWLPLLQTFGEEKTSSGYALWLERWHHLPWHLEELALLERIVPIFIQALLRPYKKIIPVSKKALWGSIAAAFFIALFIPIQSSIVAPGRVVPHKPHYVFAPFDGILKELLVEPGQLVQKDSVLFRYDPRVLDKYLEEANKAVETARAELFRLEGAGYQDPEAQGKIPVQKLEVSKAETSVKFYQLQRDQGDVQSPIEGVVVLDDPDALIGAALQTGQTIMSIADPAKTKFRIMVPVSDAGLLRLDATVEVRLDKAPLSSITAKVIHIGYDVKLSEDQTPSILVEAQWIKASPDIQPGQRGTAKIYSETTSLGLQLFRRPLIVLRKMTGF